MAESKISFEGKDGDAVAQNMADFFGPGQVDHLIRQAIQTCWIALPKDRKNVTELELQLRRIFERGIKDMREDAEQFGRPV